MKKVTSVLLATSILLAGCGNSSSDSNDKKADSKSSSENKKELKHATTEYKKYTDKQLDEFLKGTEEFTKAVKDKDTEKAKELYPKVRMYYERSEPVAESFGDLDPKIDARLADMKEDNKENEWTGYHKIE